MEKFKGSEHDLRHIPVKRFFSNLQRGVEIAVYGDRLPFYVRIFNRVWDAESKSYPRMHQFDLEQLYQLQGVIHQAITWLQTEGSAARFINHQQRYAYVQSFYEAINEEDQRKAEPIPKEQVIVEEIKKLYKYDKNSIYDYQEFQKEFKPQAWEKIVEKEAEEKKERLLKAREKIENERRKWKSTAD